REQVMQRLLVRAADVHARPAPDRLQPLQHFDIGGRIGLGSLADLAGTVGLVGQALCQVRKEITDRLAHAPSHLSEEWPGGATRNETRRRARILDGRRLGDWWHAG